MQYVLNQYCYSRGRPAGAAPPGAGPENSAGAKAPPGAGPEKLAGAKAPPGAGSRNLAGGKAPPGAGPENLAGAYPGLRRSLVFGVQLDSLEKK